jgi:hypothetical protein
MVRVRSQLEMRVAVLAGILLLLAAPAYADELPDAMMGDWGMGDETGQMERAGPDSGDFHVDKDWYAGVDDRCEILKVEKQAENLYTVQARCAYDGNDDSIPSRIDTDEFELLGNGKLLITPVSS